MNWKILQGHDPHRLTREPWCLLFPQLRWIGLPSNIDFSNLLDPFSLCATLPSQSIFTFSSCGIPPCTVTSQNWNITSVKTGIAAAAAAANAKSLQLCPTLCNPIDSSPPGSPVPGILQARTLEWVAISVSNAWKWKVKVKLLSRVWLFATHGLQPTRLLRPGVSLCLFLESD